MKAREPTHPHQFLGNNTLFGFEVLADNKELPWRPKILSVLVMVLVGDSAERPSSKDTLQKAEKEPRHPFGVRAQPDQKVQKKHRVACFEPH